MAQLLSRRLPVLRSLVLLFDILLVFALVLSCTSNKQIKNDEDDYSLFACKAHDDCIVKRVGCGLAMAFNKEKCCCRKEISEIP